MDIFDFFILCEIFFCFARKATDTIGKWFSKLRNKKQKSAKTRFIDDDEPSDTEPVPETETPESDPDTNTEEPVSDTVPAAT